MKHSEFEPLPLMQDMVFAKMFENNQSAGALKGLINAVLRDAGLPPVSEIIEVKSEYTLLGDLIDQKKNDSSHQFHEARNTKGPRRVS